MKYLKIENDKGMFRTGESTSWQDIDKINKEDLLILIDLALTKEFEMDEFDRARVNNQAHQIIYGKIYEKLMELLANKNRFKDESESLYKEAMEKYSS